MNKESRITVRFYKMKASSYTSMLGLNLYHSAIEFDDVEYCYEGYVNEINPKSYRSTLYSNDNDSIVMKEFVIGACKRSLFYSTLSKIKLCFSEDDYNLLSWNCNHFTYQLLRCLFIEYDYHMKESIFCKLYITTGNFWKINAFNKQVADYSIKLEQLKTDILKRPIRLQVMKTNTCSSTTYNSQLSTATNDSDEVLKEDSVKSKIISLKKFVPHSSLSLRNLSIKCQSNMKD